jgi:hypothetical protein
MRPMARTIRMIQTTTGTAVDIGSKNTGKHRIRTTRNARIRQNAFKILEAASREVFFAINVSISI